MPAVLAPQGPVFVVGSMRAGSTLLRLILDSHPHLAIPPETGFMGGLRAVKEIPQWQFGRGWYERLGWREEEVDARLREFYGGIFERYAAAQGKPRWGEKTPFHTEHVTEMAQVFPDACFAGIVRHPAAVAASLRKRFHYSFAEGVDYWAATNAAMLRSAVTLDGRFGLLRYEDLLTRREPVLRQLLDLLGEPWSERVLEHHRVHREKGTPRAAEGSTVTSEPVDPARATQWVDAVSGTDLAALRRVGDLAAVFGYGVAVPAGGPGDPPDPLVLTGSALSARATGVDVERHLRQRPAVAPDADPRELAARLARVEEALVRARSRRAIRWVDACRKVQHGRSWADVRTAWTMVRSPRPAGTGEPVKERREDRGAEADGAVG